MPRVFIVDDQHIILNAVTRILELNGFRTEAYESAQVFLRNGTPMRPGCLVLDLTMPDMNGLDVLEEMVRMQSKLPVIFLTGNGNIDTAVRAMKHGASDFLTKPVNAEKLLMAVRSAFEKNRIALLADSACQEIRRRLDTLTPREREVINLIAAGKLNKQAADELGVAEQTIKIHRSRAMAKMKMRTVAELVHLLERIDG